jgi:hypothetical protein
VLDINLLSSVPSRLWDTAGVVAEPVGAHVAVSFEASEAAMNLRRHRRLPLRGQLLVVTPEVLLGCQATDMSTAGLGFVSPVQLFPLDAIVVVTDQIGKLPLVVRRCRRKDAQSYQCGAEFIDGAKTPTEFRDLVRQFSTTPARP